MIRLRSIFLGFWVLFILNCYPAHGQEEAEEAATVQGILEEAKQAAEGIQDNEIKSYALRDVGVLQLKAGNQSGSDQTFQEAAQAAGAIEKDRKKTQAFQTMIMFRANAGDIAGALQTANGIGDLKTKGDALSAIASAQARKGDQSGSEGTFDAALQAANAIQDERIKVASLSAIGTAQARAGDLSGALETVGAISDEKVRFSTLGQIARSQAVVGDLSGTNRGLWMLIWMKKLRPRVWQVL